MKQKFWWVLKTFAGYTTVHATLDKLYYTKHRFLRQPKMWSKRTGKPQGAKLDLVVYDEYALLTEAQVKELEKLSAGDNEF